MTILVYMDDNRPISEKKTGWKQMTQIPNHSIQHWKGTAALEDLHKNANKATITPPVDHIEVQSGSKAMS